MHAGTGVFCFLQIVDTILQLWAKDNSGFEVFIELDPAAFGINICDNNWHFITVNKTGMMYFILILLN